MTKFINILQKITQIGILGFLFYWPWTWPVWAILPVIMNLILLIVTVIMEFGGRKIWINLKFINTPKKVIHLGTEKDNKYYIDIIDTGDSSWSDKYVVIYSRLFPIWWRLYDKKVSFSDTAPIEVIEGSVKDVIKKYENKLKDERKREERKRKEIEAKKGSRSKLRKWDGLMGDEGKKVAYKRGKRLDQILGKDKE